MSRRVQTVEQTGKIWKIQILLAVLLCIVGVVHFVMVFNDRSLSVGVFGIEVGPLLVVAGIAWLIFARVGSWWHHG